MTLNSSEIWSLENELDGRHVFCYDLEKSRKIKNILIHKISSPLFFLHRRGVKFLYKSQLYSSSFT